ncbi:hypothetical protein [Trichloromonas sp.]|uniref:hypothetical protein n=1 Tax=Trichloromonas sp. TaxID=3069249 RepID=UPI003D81C0D8
MLKITSTTDPRLARLPPAIRIVVTNQLLALRSTCRGDPDPEKDGFVGYVEPQDTPQSVESAIGLSLSQIEGVFLDGGCMVGVILWGNSGAGVSLVCPQSFAHALQVAQQLREHLPSKESSDERSLQP